MPEAGIYTVAVVGTLSTPEGPGPNALEPAGVAMPQVGWEESLPPVLIMNMPPVTLGDTLTPHGEPEINPLCGEAKDNRILQGISTVLVNGHPIAVGATSGKGSLCACGHALTPANTTGAPMTVLVGGVLGP